MPIAAQRTETLVDSVDYEQSVRTDARHIQGGAAVSIGRRGAGFWGIAATDTDLETPGALFRSSARKRSAKKTEAVISAVVQEVRDNSVSLICDLPGEKIRVSLPRDIVGDALAVFGTPVSLKLETRRGFRVPVVERRVVTPVANQMTREVDAWIDSIDVTQ